MHIISFSKYDPNIDNRISCEGELGVHFRINTSDQTQSNELGMDFPNLKDLKLDLGNPKAWGAVIETVRDGIKEDAQNRNEHTSVGITIFCNFQHFTSSYEKFYIMLAKELKKLQYIKISLILSQQDREAPANIPKEFKNYFDLIDILPIYEMRHEYPHLKEKELEKVINNEKMLYSYMIDHLIKKKKQLSSINAYAFSEIGIHEKEIPAGVHKICEKIKKEHSRRNSILYEEYEYHVFLFSYTQTELTGSYTNILENCVKRELNSKNVFLKKDFLGFEDHHIWVSIIATKKKKTQETQSTIKQEYRVQYEESVAEKSIKDEQAKATDELLYQQLSGEISTEEYSQKNSEIYKASNAMEIQSIIRNQKGNTPPKLLD